MFPCDLHTRPFVLAPPYHISLKCSHSYFLPIFSFDFVFTSPVAHPNVSLCRRTVFAVYRAGADGVRTHGVARSASITSGTAPVEYIMVTARTDQRSKLEVLVDYRGCPLYPRLHITTFLTVQSSRSFRPKMSSNHFRWQLFRGFSYLVSWVKLV